MMQRMRTNYICRVSQLSEQIYIMYTGMHDYGLVLCKTIIMHDVQRLIEEIQSNLCIDLACMHHL